MNIEREEFLTQKDFEMVGERVDLDEIEKIDNHPLGDGDEKFQKEINLLDKKSGVLQFDRHYIPKRERRGYLD